MAGRLAAVSLLGYGIETARAPEGGPRSFTVKGQTKLKTTAVAPAGRAGYRQTGFTLVEVLVVVVILSIVAAIAVIAVSNALDTARQRATMADMRSLASAIESYMVDNDTAPLATGSVQALIGTLTPRYATSLPLEDHWDHEYSYVANGQSYTVESFGKDGSDGADVSLATRFDFSLDIVFTDGRFVAAPQ